jgi:predicted Fe-S protein YdhL (DUF1289 family)
MKSGPNIESPCKLICTLDISSGVCTGCGRTRADIAMWTRYSDAQRALANIDAKKRMKEMEA